VVSLTPRPLYARGRAPGTHWIGGWVGPRAGLDAIANRKIPAPPGNVTPDVESAVTPVTVSLAIFMDFD